jgi:hypothetical protein
VTYGQSQGDHQFDEGITPEGVLSWQSQPSYTFENKVIQTLINHDETVNNIYLFLREEKKGDYEYIGKLKYLNHDKEREKPVYFQWQLLDSKSINEDNELGLTNEGKKEDLGAIRLTNSKPDSKKKGVTKDNFRASKSPDYALKESRNRKLSLLGEELVSKHEINNLISEGRKDLADKVVHVSKIEGDGAGYDIRSFDEYGSIKYIEVKTTRGGINTDFYMSPRELLFSKKHEEEYFLYRVFNLDKKNNGEFYILKGDVEKEFNKTPTGYRISMK